MDDLLGFLAIILVSLFTLLLSLKNPKISRIILIALVIRISFLLLGHFLISLPDSTADAVTFEELAWLISQDGFYNLLTNFNGPTDKFISWLIAIPYSLFGRSVLMAKSLSLFFGILNVYLGWKLAEKIWDNDTAVKVAWILALFPSLILYSVLIMREVYVCFFLLIALNGIVSWFKNNSFNSFILAIAGFVGATFFHGAMMIGGIIFILIVGIISSKNILLSLFKLSIRPKYFIFFLIFLVGSGLYLTNKIKVPKLKHFEHSTQIESLLRKTIISTRGDASYPEWTKANSPIELIYKMPIRATYFLFSPFPWNVHKSEHMIGMLDAFLYMYFVYLIILNREVIRKNPVLKIILLILLCYIFVFSVGVGNFGTSVRHRSKFIIMIVLLSAPLIKKFVLFKK